jgi:hypothetical protein
MTNKRLEDQLRAIGILPAEEIEELDVVPDVRHTYLAKDYYNDPRDIYGEVNH